MIREAINRILELKGPQIKEIDGIKFCNENLSSIETTFIPERVDVETLGGLVIYIRSQGIKPKFIHVASPKRVIVMSEEKGVKKKRQQYLCADIGDYDEFPFGRWLYQEDFVIKAMTLIKDNKDRLNLISIAGNIKDQSIKNISDDGFTQTVEQTKGIALIDKKEIKAIIVLRPYRTFREVDQPDSIFLLRIRNTDGGVQLALFEADGSAWRRTAIENVAKYIKKNIADNIPVIS